MLRGRYVARCSGRITAAYDDRPSACRAWASKDAAAYADGSGTPVPFQTLVARASISFLRDIFKLAAPEPLPLALAHDVDLRDGPGPP
jgi:hypothetical protein